MNDVPVQLVRATTELPYTVFAQDQTCIDEADADRRLLESLARPFDLSRELPIRFELASIGPQHHVLMVVIHQIASDEASLATFLEDVASLYERYSQYHGTSSLAATYTSSAGAIHHDLTAAHEQAQRYWRQQLGTADAPAPTLLELPTDGHRSAQRRLCTATHSFEVAETLTQQLQRFAMQREFSLESLLLAGFATLLARCSEQRDLVVGVVARSADSAGTAPTIGPWSSLLPLRADLSDEPAATVLVERIQDGLDQANQHAAFSFDQLLADLAIEPDSSHHPLVQVAFQYHERLPSRSSGELQILPERISVAPSLMDLTLEVTSGDGMLQGQLRYDSDLFRPQTIERLQDHYLTLLAQMVAQPAQSIARLPIFTSQQWTELVHRWNATATPVPSDQSLTELFEAQVLRTPDAVAMTYLEHQVTYAELQQRVERLASVLLRHGAQTDMLVGILLERNIDFITALLATMKAGTACVPLDLRQPARVHAQIMQQSKSTLLISASPFQQAVARIQAELPGHALQVIQVDGHLGEVDARALAAVPRYPTQLAYAMFTSGSTGTPKGVLVEQAGMINHIFGKIHDLQMTCDDTIAQLGPPCFDIVIWQCLAALLLGGKVHVVPDDVINDPFALLEEIARQEITLVQIVPALMRAFVHAARVEPTPLPKLRWMIPTGDALPTELSQLWLDLYPAIPILNTYGSTECSDDQCHYRIEQIAPGQYPPIMPIGQPIGNITAYILDAYLQPVPIGVPGQLYMGGAGVGRGYLNQPDLTAERFIPDPFSDSPGARLYSTRDRARYRPDGVIEFLGRLDFMVKIRGFRIELDAIDAVLRRHPKVSDSIVVVRNGQLVAYIVAQPGPAPKSGDVRTFLEQELPEYMVPAAIMVLDRLPLSANGKVDRRALPAPELPADRPSANIVAPRTPIEAQLAAILSDALHGAPVSVQASFFDLGIDSLLAMQVSVQIKEALQVQLPLRELLTNPTIAQLATVIEDRRQASQGDTQPELPLVVHARPEQRHEPFALTDLQQAYWVGQSDLFELGNVTAHEYVEVECVGLDLDAAQRALNHLIVRHDMLRAVILPDGRQQVLESVPPYTIAYLDLRSVSSEQQLEHVQSTRERMVQDGPRTDRWPLFEIVVHQLSSDRYRVSINVGLLLIDAQTEHLLVQEWLQLYQSAETTLPPIDLTYRDYLGAYAAYMDSPAGQRAWEYWQQRLHTLPTSPDLTLAKSPQSVVAPHFTRRRGYLPADLWRDLKAQALAAGITPNALLITCYADVLARWSKTPRFTLNVLSSTRRPVHPDVQRVVGNFGTTLPLEINAERSASFFNRARRVQQQLIDDLEHGLISGVRIVREVARTQGWSNRAALPVVFASGLNADIATTGRSSLTIRETYGALQTPQVYLDHQVYEIDGVLVFNWDCVDELFPEGMLDAMFASYCQLLEHLARHTMAWDTVTTPAIPAMPGAQIEDYPDALTCDRYGLLHTPFLAQAVAQPDQLAVVAEGCRLSYAELLGRATYVAQWLTSQQVQPNTLVGVVMEKGWEQVVAVLGILQAGAAYLPLDAALPEARMHYMLEHGQVALVLTQSWVDGALHWPAHIQRLHVDQGLVVEGVPQAAPVQQPTDLAYVIFTSGSTGLPKGVAIDHRGAVNTIADMNQRFAVTAQDRLLALSSLSFDLSVYDIFGALAAGATIVIPPTSALRDPAWMAEMVVAEQITLWNSVPALMDLLVTHLERHPQRSLALRHIFMSGDWIPIHLPERIWRLLPDVQITSLGGATEASIWSILYPITRIDPSWKSVPYGRGMANQQVYVLDHALEPCPAWTVGNLHIGGVGVALGYWRDPERTAASFITHPQTGIRLYRTGDLGRYWPDGTIEFLGREDFQVKIQGFRIELGEIEAALLSYPELQDAIVLVRDDSAGGKSLVAYLVPATASTLSLTELREFLQTVLPHYMIPAAFVVVDQFPLTANGKVDRQALPTLNQTRSLLETTREASYVGPRDPIEQRIVALWEEILDVTPIGVSDDFFALGGTSFSALRLMARIHDTFQRALSPSILFQMSTVEQLAPVLQAADKQSEPTSLVAMRPDGARPPIFFVHPVGGTVLCYSELAQQLDPEQPFYALESLGLSHTHAPHTSIQDMAAAYISAIQMVQPRGPYVLGGWSMGGVVAYEMVQQLAQQGHTTAMLVMIDSEVPSPSTWDDDAALLVQYLRDLGGEHNLSQHTMLLELRACDPDQRLQRALTLGQQAGVVPAHMDLEHWSRIYAIFKANMLALASYTPQPYAGKIDLIRASNAHADPEDALGWSDVTHVEVVTLPGTHYTLLTQPSVGDVAARIEFLIGSLKP